MYANVRSELRILACACVRTCTQGKPLRLICLNIGYFRDTMQHAGNGVCTQMTKKSREEKRQKRVLDDVEGGASVPEAQAKAYQETTKKSPGRRSTRSSGLCI